MKFICRDCETKQEVTSVELLRLGKPRCCYCGGTLLDLPEGKFKSKRIKRAKGLRCRGCGTLFVSRWGGGGLLRSHEGLWLHLRHSPRCHDEYTAKEHVELWAKYRSEELGEPNEYEKNPFPQGKGTDQSLSEV